MHGFIEGERLQRTQSIAQRDDGSKEITAAFDALNVPDDPVKNCYHFRCRGPQAWDLNVAKVPLASATIILCLHSVVAQY